MVEGQGGSGDEMANVFLIIGPDPANASPSADAPSPGSVHPTASTRPRASSGSRIGSRGS